MLNIKVPLRVGFGVSWKRWYWYVVPYLILLKSAFPVLSWPVDSHGDLKCAKVTLENATELTLNNSDKNCSKIKNVSFWIEINSSIISDNFVDLLKTKLGDCGLRYDRVKLHVNPGCAVHSCGGGDNEDNKCVRIEGNKDNVLDFSNRENYLFNSTCTCEEPMFDPRWIGIIYSAYDKYPEPCKEDSSLLCPVYWWDYSKEEIVQNLELISTRFQQVSTYGMGTTSVYKENEDDWKKGPFTSTLTPLRIAEMNRLTGYHRMKAVVGVFRLPDYDKSWVIREVQNAIDATIESNELFPETIWGISVQVKFEADPPLNITEVIGYLNVIRKETTRARRDSQASRVQVGLRIKDCEKVLLGSNRSEDNSNLYCQKDDRSCRSGNLGPNIMELAKASDFIICFMLPSNELLTLSKNLTMISVVKEIGNKFLKIKSGFQKENPNISFMGETGWPSKGRSANESPNTLRNERNYWVGMSHWAKIEKFQVYMFEALDQPWKNDMKDLDKRSPKGRVCGSEAYYGLWKRVNNSSPGNHVEKFSDISGNVTSDGDELLEQAKFSEDCAIDSPLKLSVPKINVVFIIIAACFGTSAVFFVIVFYMGHRLQKAKKSQAALSQKYLEMFLQGLPSDSTKGDGNLDYQVIALQFPYDKKKYELPQERFEIDTSVSLGKGQSGTAYRGKIHGQFGYVAFKSTGINNSIMDIKNLLSEIKIMSYIGKHENVVCLLGAHTENLEKGIVSVALEYCSFGSLEKFFDKYRNHFRPVGTTMTNQVSTNYSTLASQPDDAFTTIYYFKTGIMNERDFEPEFLTEKELEFDVRFIPMDQRTCEWDGISFF